MFNHLRGCQTAFQSVCSIVPPTMSVFRSLYISSHVLCVFFITAILVGVKQYLIVTLMCMPLVTNDVEHLFIDLLAMCVSSLDRCLLELCAHFLIG